MACICMSWPLDKDVIFQSSCYSGQQESKRKKASSGIPMMDGITVTPGRGEPFSISFRTLRILNIHDSASVLQVLISVSLLRDKTAFCLDIPGVLTIRQYRNSKAPESRCNFESKAAAVRAMHSDAARRPTIPAAQRPEQPRQAVISEVSSLPLSSDRQGWLCYRHSSLRA